MISIHFQGKPFNNTVIQVYATITNAEEAEVEWCYEDLHDLLELTPKKGVHFIIGDWNAKVESQEILGSNHWTITFISHASKVILKILQARLQH